MTQLHRPRGLAALALAATLALAGGARGDETLRVGKAIAGPFDFTPLDVGMAKGFFGRHGLAIAETDFAGSAKLQQGLAANAIDIGLGSGPELAFVAKGNSDLGVAAFAGPPDGLVLVVRADSPIRTVADLKGQKISVSTVGGLTDWMVHEVSRQQGWGPDGIDVIAARQRRGADRGAAHQADRGHAARRRRRGAPRAAGRGAHPAAVRRGGEGLHQPYHLCHRRDHRRPSRRGPRLQRGVVRDGEVDAPEQGRDGRRSPRR